MDNIADRLPKHNFGVETFFCSKYVLRLCQRLATVVALVQIYLDLVLGMLILPMTLVRHCRVWMKTGKLGTKDNTLGQVSDVCELIQSEFKHNANVCNVPHAQIWSLKLKPKSPVPFSPTHA